MEWLWRHPLGMPSPSQVRNVSEKVSGKARAAVEWRSQSARREFVRLLLSPGRAGPLARIRLPPMTGDPDPVGLLREDRVAPLIVLVAGCGGNRISRGGRRREKRVMDFCCQERVTR